MGQYTRKGLLGAPLCQGEGGIATPYKKVYKRSHNGLIVGFRSLFLHYFVLNELHYVIKKDFQLEHLTLV